jgi:alpha-amylase/alpha-mannosidase (GH57 family)
MAGIENNKLPTTEQVEWMMAQWDNYSIDEFAKILELEKSVIEKTVSYLRQLKRSSGDNDIPAITCYRKDKLRSIVRCAGANHGYVME